MAFKRPDECRAYYRSLRKLGQYYENSDNQWQFKLYPGDQNYALSVNRFCKYDKVPIKKLRPTPHQAPEYFPEYQHPDLKKSFSYFRIIILMSGKTVFDF